MKNFELFHSPVLSFFIFLGLSFTLFLLYLIGTEVYKVHSLEKVFQELAEENNRLADQNNTLEEESVIRQTLEYIDRFAKENQERLNEGEIEIILPKEENKEEEFKGLSDAELFLEIKKKRPVREQWIEIFFGK